MKPTVLTIAFSFLFAGVGLTSKAVAKPGRHSYKRSTTTYKRGVRTAYRARRARAKVRARVRQARLRRYRIRRRSVRQAPRSRYLPKPRRIKPIPRRYRRPYVSPSVYRRVPRRTRIRHYYRPNWVKPAYYQVGFRRVTLENPRDYSVLVQAKVGNHGDCSFNQSYGTRSLGAGQSWTIATPSRVVCYRRIFTGPYGSQRVTAWTAVRATRPANHSTVM